MRGRGGLAILHAYCPAGLLSLLFVCIALLGVFRRSRKRDHTCCGFSSWNGACGCIAGAFLLCAALDRGTSFFEHGPLRTSSRELGSNRIGMDLLLRGPGKHVLWA